MTTNVIVLNSEPGIQRDGTPYDTKSYIDGQWVRFYRGRPRKIGGYRLIEQGSSTIIRTIYNYDNPMASNSVDTYLGREDSVGYERFNYNGESTSGFINRTPTTGFVPNVNNLWNFDVFIKTDLNPLIVANLTRNANDINSSFEGPIYYGNAEDNATLTQVTNAGEPVLASGGVIFAPPILIAYGNNGGIQWSHSGDIDNWYGHQNIANNKIIKMVLTRGSSFPQLLAWTSNSLISLSYNIDDVAETDFFSAVTIDNKITIMSPNSIVGFANQYFWIGLNQFYFFNGIVQPLQNTMNAEFFFQGIDLRSRAKVWGEIVNPATGGTEIWWHYPKIDPEHPEIVTQECTDVIIYHVEMKKWSNTSLGRAAGAQIGPFPLPMMSDNQLLPSTGTYPLWMHEYGYDKQIGGVKYPIRSYFETHIYDFFEGNPANNRAMRTRRIEPNFSMTAPDGDVSHMTVTVKNRFFPSDTDDNNKIQVKGPYLFDNNTQKIDDVNSQGRLVSFVFESNEVGGGYTMGKTLLNYDIGDVRPSGNGASQG
jgi:hypothetical protein